MESEFWKRVRTITPRMTDVERSKFLQRICQVRQASVSRWKTGENEPSPKRYRLICAATGAAFSYLYEGREPMFDKPKPGSRADELLTIFHALGDQEQRDAIAYVKYRKTNPMPR